MAFFIQKRRPCSLRVLLYPVLLLAACCGLLEKFPTLAIKLSPGVKLRLAYVTPMKLYVGRYEVSNAEYRSFRPGHSSGNYQGRNLNDDDQPVVNVSWNDAQAFCDWLTKNHGMAANGRLTFRLPTEEEWETFATCGRNTEYPWGDAWPPPEKLNYFGMENRGIQRLSTSDGYKVSCPVRKSGANDWGLYGVGGNVWEWCSDVDPQDSRGMARILKGASWSDCVPVFLRTNARRSYPPDYKYMYFGFRVVAEASAAQAPSSVKSKPPVKNDQPVE